MGLELSNIYKEYKINGDNEIQSVLNGVNLTITDGEMIAIMGKSGAGKSTLLHIIGLLDICDQGTYKLDGEDISDFTNKQRAKIRNEKIGFVLQDFGLVEDETVMENVSLPLMLSRTSMKKIREVALEKMKKVGVEHLSNKKVSVLSGGEKQRVAIARALVCDPEYIMGGFNNRYLLDALRNARTEQVRMEISGPLSPVKVLPVEGNDFLYLVLPVRFKND